MNLVIDDEIGYWGDEVFYITHGRGGIKQDKVEGDGATPVGTFPFRCVYYRRDRIGDLETALPKIVITPDQGWCDDPEDLMYNRLVKLPYPARHEEMWREDHRYDIVIVVGYNDDPVVKNKGSAVFIHIKHENGTPTSGCIGLEKEDLIHVLKTTTLESCLTVNSL